jgi:hypothetical protein
LKSARITIPTRTLATRLAGIGSICFGAGCGGADSAPLMASAGGLPTDTANAGAGGDGGGVSGSTAEPGPALGGRSAQGGSGGSVNELRPVPERPDFVNASGYRWSSVKIGGGGFVSGIITSRQQQGLIFARTDVGGAYRWDELNSAWLPLTDWVSEEETGLLGVESIALDPREPWRVYLLAGINYFNNGKTALLRSEDFGETFTVHDVTSQLKAHGNGAGRQSGERLAVDPNDGNVLYTGSRDAGLFRSADRGVTWTPVTSLDVTSTPNGNGIAFVLFDPSSGSIGTPTPRLYVGVSRAEDTNLYVSSDAGVSWSPVEAQPTAYAPQRAVLSDAGVLHVTYANGAGPNPTETDAMDGGEIWKLDTASGSWTDITPLRAEANRAFGGISVSASNPNRLVATTINTYLMQPWGYGDRIFLSDDAGATWTDLIGQGRVAMDTNGFPWIEGQAIHWAGSIEIDPFNPERAFVTSGNGIFMSEDLSAPLSTWTFAVDGLEETVPLDAVSVPGGPLVSVLGDYDGFLHSTLTESPAAGRHSPAIGTTQGVAVAAAAVERMARVGNELYLSSDSGATWQLATRPSTATGGHLAYASDGSVLLWSVGDSVQRTADAGETWSLVSSLAVETLPIADSVNPDKFYAYDRESGAFYVSSDRAVSFATGVTLATGGARRIAAVPGVEGEVWVALEAAGLGRSTDSGSSFQIVAAVNSCRAIGFGAPAPGQNIPATYIWGSVGAGPRGVYRSDDAGVTWLRVNDDAHEYGGPGNGELVIGDANTYGRVFMSSAGRGLVMGEWVGAPDAGAEAQ